MQPEQNLRICRLNELMKSNQERLATLCWSYEHATDVRDGSSSMGSQGCMMQQRTCPMVAVR